MRRALGRRLILAGAIMGLVAAACGSDGDSSSSGDTTASEARVLVADLHPIYGTNNPGPRERRDWINAFRAYRPDSPATWGNRARGNDDHWATAVAEHFTDPANQHTVRLDAILPMLLGVVADEYAEQRHDERRYSNTWVDCEHRKPPENGSAER